MERNENETPAWNKMSDCMTKKENPQPSQACKYVGSYIARVQQLQNTKFVEKSYDYLETHSILSILVL